MLVFYHFMLWKMAACVCMDTLGHTLCPPIPKRETYCLFASNWFRVLHLWSVGQQKIRSPEISSALHILPFDGSPVYDMGLSLFSTIMRIWAYMYIHTHDASCFGLYTIQKCKYMYMYKGLYTVNLDFQCSSIYGWPTGIPKLITEIFSTLKNHL